MNMLRRYWIRLTAWEYWPFEVVYFPVFFYWAWMIIRARSFFFFRYANPQMENGGFLMESKWSIYKQLPAGSYPTTLLVSNPGDPEQVLKQLRAKGLSFPLIAKPDVGMRGMQVAVLANEADLLQYMASSPVNFLIQAYVDYPMEAGIFYCRMPGTNRGVITGIVQKEMLQVVGDGKSTLFTLIEQHDRAFLQMQLLEKSLGEALYQVLPEGEEKVLVPLGNHARGSLFRDVSFEADAALNERIHALCQQIPEFYYGRLDIRFTSWDELRAGRGYSIIEVNGAGSEPTHIYDPKHSIGFAWREIIRHLRWLYQISMANKKRQACAGMSFREGWQMMRLNKQHVALLEATRLDVESIGIR